ncbi:MAG: FAD-dependent oxidoreductase [Candidatus Korobacteraceae bacterium]
MSVPQPKSLRDLPITAYATRPTSENNTGTWKYVEPRYEDRLPPCAQACPAGNDISRIILLLAGGDLIGAGRLLRSGNPLPATLGRVCPHFCECQCNRDLFGGSIAVHMIERFLGDLLLRDESAQEPVTPSGREVAVIGAGPAGITAAYALALKGHEVEVFDEKPKPGGYLRTGIPDYRLPKEILDREIEFIERVGVKFIQGIRIGRDIGFEDLRSRFDAVIAAVGLHESRAFEVPGSDHRHIYDGVELLERILSGEIPELPSTVAVVGGGNTAIDVARSLLRLGVSPTIVYRRSATEMPAIASEVEEANREGVGFQFLTTPIAVVIEDDAVVALECCRMQLGEPDASGRRTPVPIPNSEFRLPFAGIVAAIGETADLGFLRQAAATGKRSLDGFYIAGDASTGEGTVAAAVGSGRRVAAMVHSYLVNGGTTADEPTLQSLWPRKVNTALVAGPQYLNPAYFAPALRPEIAKLNGEQPPSSFAEIVQGFAVEQALSEARRCLLCGTCNGCLNCYYWCPDVAVHRDSRNGAGLEIDSMHCKGCGICVEECPRGAMTLEEVAR